MTGDYKILISAEPSWYKTDVWRKRWSCFVALCQSLHADGLCYTVVWRLDEPVPHVRVMALGQAIPRPKAKAAKRSPNQGKLTLDICERRHLEASKALNNIQAWKRDGKATLADLEEAIAEAEYWRELCILAGKRFDQEAAA